MIVRTALMINAPSFPTSEARELVGSPEIFNRLKIAFNNPLIGEFGSVFTLEEKNVQSVKNEIQHFYSKREHHELLLLYINGYELVQQNGKIYFVDPNSQLNSLEETAISAQFIHDQVKSCKADKKILMIDCFSREELSADEIIAREESLATFSRETDSFVLISQDTEGSTRTSLGVKSPGFSESLLEGLTTGDADLDGRGYITEDELFIYLYKKMNTFGVHPNLFMSQRDEFPSMKIARNINFSKLPDYGKESGSIDIGRYLRLVGEKRKVTTPKEKESIENIIRSQPENVFIKRLVGAVGTVIGVSILGGLMLDLSLDKAIPMGLIAFAGVLGQAIITRYIN